MVARLPGLQPAKLRVFAPAEKQKKPEKISSFTKD
jgi:hypothetical protein